MSKKLYTVVIGDLVDSRAVPDRRRAAGTLRKALSEGTRAFAGELEAPPALTKGIDEFAAVLRSPAPVFRLCRRINFSIHPLRFRFAVIRGAIDIGIETGDAARMDGPAFHAASDGIDSIRGRKESYFFQLGRDPQAATWLNVLANTVQVIMNGWTANQVAVVALADEIGVQKEIAKRRKVTPQAVSDALKAANWSEVARAFALIDDYLAEVS